jgi:hypothetical protein
MDVAEIAAFLGTYAVEATGKQLVSFRHLSDGLANNDLVEIAYPDDFPAKVTVPQQVYEAEHIAALRKHVNLMVGDEAQEFRRTFRWPQEMDKKIRHFFNRLRYQRRFRRWLLQGRRKKRFGKRRCPHLGGRSLPRRS